MRLMMRQAMGPADTSRHVMGGHVTREMRVQRALDDVMSNIVRP